MNMVTQLISLYQPRKEKLSCGITMNWMKKTGRMNHRDDRSLHGGCIVKKDIKYIAINMGFSMHLGILPLLRPVAPCGA